MNYFEKNISLLAKKGENLVKKLEEAQPLPGFNLLQSKVGLPTARVETPSGSILLHSLYDPMNEARRIVADLDLDNAYNVILFGFGMGYLVEAIMERSPDVNIIIVEPNIPLLKCAFMHRDLEKVIKGRTAFLLEEDAADVRRLIKTSGKIFVTGRSLFILHTPSTRIYDYTRVRKSVMDAFQWLEMNLRTAQFGGHQFQENTILNIPNILDSAPIRNFKDAFKGVPAICVAAGPSLEKNVHLLREAKGKALIIAVNTALKVLLRHNIKPDIVASIEFRPSVYQHFKDIMDATDDIILFYDPELYPKIVEEFRGEKIVCLINKPVPVWLSQFINVGFMKKGITVAHSCFYLAEFVGADPIVLIGQDLCYPGAVSHAEGAANRRRLAIGIDDNGRQYLLRFDENNGIEKIEPLLWAEDINGELVPTSPDMYSYITHFGEMIKASSAHCIDATEGGARIEGTQIMTLRQVIDEYCTQEVPVQEILQEGLRERVSGDIPRLAEELRKTAQDLEEMASLAEEGMEVLDKIFSRYDKGVLLDKNGEFTPAGRKLADRSWEITEQILRRPRIIHEFIGIHAAGHRYMLDVKDVQGRRLEGPAKLKNRMEKLGIFYEAMKGAGGDLAQLFHRVADEVAQRLEEGAYKCIAS